MRLFGREEADSVIGAYVIEHIWDAPPGTGEICMFDNRTVLHASFHRKMNPGYKIAVQYLY
ncbi:MAG: hypothetical protein HN644_04765 [Rhodospirillales bacterium]|jgi:hypothetical protein|nr:hypothetical protein [Rhodospirillales bacterium]MBT4041129.1 hypothetical protein [Rhodospirillales bacterium]MBT4626717.1 hypothetical protein [Rhodospirillales bacterium]MBT5350723.1 hypothetical protein [Rhodospirillales bacterium]MBT5519561.1 hypothetical protein [Rhodospirillales bacterium]